MCRRLVVYMPVVLACVVLGWRGPGPGGEEDRILGLYRRSDSLFHLSHSTPVTDSLALAGFRGVISALETPASHGRMDSLLAAALLRKAILLDAVIDYTGAKEAYRRAL